MAIIEGALSGYLAEVDANNNIKTNLPTTLTQAGYAVIAGESHDGTDGESRLVRPARVSTDGRLRVGVDQLYWQDTFNHTIQDSGAYTHVTSTATLAMTGGFLVFNSGNSVASGAVARVQTYRAFPLNAHASLDVGFRLRFSAAAQANNVCEFGLGFATTTTTPTDGVYFKLNSTGALVGVLNVNGTETTTDPMPAHTINQVDYYRIVVDQDRVEFFINGVLQGAINSPTTVPAVSFARSLPLLMRLYNAAATSTAQRMEIADISVLGKDISTNRLFPTQQAGMCMNAINVARGTTAGQTANYANSAAPASATLSNTAAGYTTLGGQFQFAAVAGAETDYALFGFQVPAASAAGGNKNLYIRGVRIDTFNMGAAVATTAHLLQWALGVGATAVSLATADSATAGTRAARRISLGAQSLPVAATIGQAASPVDVNFDAPIMCEPGAFVHLILKMPVATATASQIIRGVAMFNAYWE